MATGGSKGKLSSVQGESCTGFLTTMKVTCITFAVFDWSPVDREPTQTQEEERAAAGYADCGALWQPFWRNLPQLAMGIGQQACKGSFRLKEPFLKFKRVDYSSSGETFKS